MRVDTTARAFLRSNLKPTEIEAKVRTALQDDELELQELVKSPLQALEIYELEIKGLG